MGTGPTIARGALPPPMSAYDRAAKARMPMTAVLKQTPVAGRALAAHELHPLVKRLIDAMVADIVAEETNGKNPP
jgi:hypothetical protein